MPCVFDLANVCKKWKFVWISIIKIFVIMCVLTIPVTESVEEDLDFCAAWDTTDG